MPVIPALTIIAGEVSRAVAMARELPPVAVVAPIQRRQHIQLKGDNTGPLDVTFDHVFNKGGVIVFTGDVVVKLDLTTLRTSSLTVDEVKKTAVASGLTSIDDPEATISCTDFAINYADHTGKANNFYCLRVNRIDGV